MWVGLMFMGMSLLFWVGVTAFIVWALMRWVAPRLRNSPLMTSNIMQPQQPSAVETLATAMRWARSTRRRLS